MTLTLPVRPGRVFYGLFSVSEAPSGPHSEDQSPQGMTLTLPVRTGRVFYGLFSVSEAPSGPHS